MKFATIRVARWGKRWGKIVARRLSARFVATAREPGRFSDGDNLYLLVDPSGAKRWAFIFKLDGKQREMGLGSATKVSLASARDRAAEARAQLGRGVNPIADRKRVTSKATFGSLCDSYIREHAVGWKGDKTEAGWRNSLVKHAKPLGDLKPDQVTTQHVLDVVRPLWTSRPETAQKTLNRIERVLDAATVHGLRSGDNPARWRGHLEHLLPRAVGRAPRHHPAMPYEQVPSFISALSQSSAAAALPLSFLVLTAAREAMVLFATWGQLNVDSRQWTVPSERMKSRAGGVGDFVVPLSAPAMAVVAAAARWSSHADPDALVFPGAKAGRPMSNMTMDMLMRRAGLPYVPHGFRSSFRDWAGDMTDHPREVVEGALAHAIGNAVERAYRRRDALEKRRRLMEDWGAYCVPQPSPEREDLLAQPR